ncbi:hypothetical protein BH09VER1_BH09VER1_08250 [soil metagenome]
MSNPPKSTLSATAFPVHLWQRDPRNPVLPPGQEEYDDGCCMNPFIVVQGNEYYLFYAGGSQKDGGRRICLATCKVGDIGNWKRYGVVVDRGEAGSFDASWCVVPCVHRFGDKWHLYYTGRNPELGTGLQSFTGIGLATSDDLIHWTRHSSEPVLRGDGFPEWPDNKGIAGGGSLIEIPQEDGRMLYRMYYTLAVGTQSKNILVDQAKYAVVAHSYDGIEWFDKRVVLRPRLDADYENAACIALTIVPSGSGWRAIYAGIGTRFGYYSIAEAASVNGLDWERGEPDENLALAPQGNGWESKMVEYPNVIEENGKLRLFYCGNGYGTTGIGTALAEKLNA